VCGVCVMCGMCTVSVCECGVCVYSGDLPDPGIEPMSPVLSSGFFTTEPPGKPSATYTCLRICNTRERLGNYYQRKFQENRVLKSKLPYCGIINGYVHI